jgi:hypothetical protein
MPVMIHSTSIDRRLDISFFHPARNQRENGPVEGYVVAITDGSAEDVLHYAYRLDGTLIGGPYSIEEAASQAIPSFRSREIDALDGYAETLKFYLREEDMPALAKRFSDRINAINDERAKIIAGGFPRPIYA